MAAYPRTVRISVQYVVIMATTGDQEFLEFVIKGIVDHPDDVKIDRKVDEMGVLLTLSLNAQDMSRVIGRQGATAKSIRSLLRIVGLKNNARVNLKINEPEGSTRGVNRPAPAASDAPVAPTASSVDDVVEDLKLD